MDRTEQKALTCTFLVTRLARLQSPARAITPSITSLGARSRWGRTCGGPDMTTARLAGPYAGRAVPQRPNDLPDYEQPPLVEVALAVQHRPLPLRQGHLGFFWSRVIQAYPRTQDLPPLESPPITSDTEHEPMITLELGGSPRVNRAWFFGHDDTRLLQVQADRFVANWRGHTGEDTYPRFESVLAEFSNSLTTFDQVLEEHGLPRRVSERVEVTYVNWIPDCALPDLLRDLQPGDDGVPGIRSDERVAYRWTLQDGGPLPRSLQMQAHTARRKEGDRVAPGCMMTFTFSAPVAPGISGDELQEAMGDGRNTIVRAFTAVTRTDMHDRWGRLK